MNKEIDEIIEQIKTAINFKKQPIPMDYNISIYDIEKLLDYITNLQEENKILKELNVCVGCNNNTDYKLRIDKAIEYIEKNNIYVETDTLRTGKWELLDILRGKDENNSI